MTYRLQAVLCATMVLALCVIPCRSESISGGAIAHWSFDENAGDIIHDSVGHSDITLTARAAERATTEDLSTLRNAILAMERSRTTRERLDADMAFHDAICRASGNRICQLLFRSIHRTLFASMKQLSDRVALDKPLMFHRRIYAAIRERDGETARQQMRDHILDARSLLGKGH